MSIRRPLWLPKQASGRRISHPLREAGMARVGPEVRGVGAAGEGVESGAPGEGAGGAVAGGEVAGTRVRRHREGSTQSRVILEPVRPAVRTTWHSSTPTSWAESGSINGAESLPRRPAAQVGEDDTSPNEWPASTTTLLALAGPLSSCPTGRGPAVVNQPVFPRAQCRTLFPRRKNSVTSFATLLRPRGGRPSPRGTKRHA